jgi:diguanylate cyclase (GGDEF)-like protein
VTGRAYKHLAFLGALGVIGWGLLALATWLPHFGPAPAPVAGTPFVLFLLVIVATRSMAFRLLPETPVSLDSAFYIAAVVCLGPVSAGWLVAVALTVDALLRLLGVDAGGRRPKHHSLVEDVLFVFYFGGMTGGLLFSIGWIFGASRPPDEIGVLVRVFALGLTLLVVHYFLQGVRLALVGHSPRAFLRRMALPGIAAEASLLPLAVVVVLIYHPKQPLGLALLGATYLLINFVFNRLSHISESLKQRVSELETLNRTAHSLASTLQLRELIESIARETMAAIPEAEVFALAHRPAKSDDDRFTVDCFDRDRGEFERLTVPGAAGISARVVEARAPLSISDLADESGMRSWLGVPIVVYDEVIGVLSVQSRERAAFGPDELRLLEAIGAQAAVAIQNARLYELATVDGLTGLYVRRYFDGRLDEELARARRFEHSFSVAILDLDDFKKINDTHGHAVGDRVLQDAAQTMRAAMRGVDIASRYGGEEFAFILPRTGIVDAHAVAERVRSDLAELRVAVGGSQVLRITVSIGVACFPESGADDADDLLRRADIALYRAKAAGKNRVELYWPEGEKAKLRVH